MAFLQEDCADLCRPGTGGAQEEIDPAAPQTPGGGVAAASAASDGLQSSNLTTAELSPMEALEVVLLSGKPLKVDLVGVTSVPDLHQVVADHLQVSPAKVQLTQAGQVLDLGSAMILDPTQGPVTVVLQTIDLSKVRLTHDSESEFDEGTGYVSVCSVFFFEDNKIWSKNTSYSSNIGGARGTDHTSKLSADKATLIVDEGNMTRSVGEKASPTVRVEFSVEQLILEAQSKEGKP